RPRLIPKKISAELEKLLANAKDDSVPIIVEMADGSSSKSAAAKLGGMASYVRRTFTNFSGVALQGSPKGAKAIADRVDVKYVSLDKTTQVTGHLETTTGASLVRSEGLGGATLNGSGIAIAILDSGISASHHSFLTNRVVASVDFTGEGRTD